jgi:hypothetical protein
VLLEAGLYQAGNEALWHGTDGERLGGALVDPSDKLVSATGNADLYSAGVRQVDGMRNQAMGLTPLWLAAGTRGIMAGLRSDDATIARSQLSHTGKTMPLGEALSGLSPTVHASDLAEVLEA